MEPTKVKRGQEAFARDSKGDIEVVRVVGMYHTCSPDDHTMYNTILVNGGERRDYPTEDVSQRMKDLM